MYFVVENTTILPVKSQCKFNCFFIDIIGKNGYNQKIRNKIKIDKNKSGQLTWKIEIKQRIKEVYIVLWH